MCNLLNNVEWQSKQEKSYINVGREPSIQEISEEIGVEKEEIVMALESSYQPEYLYEIVYQNDTSTILNKIKPI